MLSKVDLEGVKSRTIGLGFWVEVELDQECIHEKISKERKKQGENGKRGKVKNGDEVKGEA